MFSALVSITYLFLYLETFVRNISLAPPPSFKKSTTWLETSPHLGFIMYSNFYNGWITSVNLIIYFKRDILFYTFEKRPVYYAHQNHCNSKNIAHVGQKFHNFLYKIFDIIYKYLHEMYSLFYSAVSLLYDVDSLQRPVYQTTYR
jgi:hypothetical protein